MDKLKKLKEIIYKKSILYVESDKALQEEMKTFLLDIYEEVHQSYDGLNALKQFIIKKPDFVITDLDLTKKDAIEMIVDMQDANEDTPIIVLTSKNENYELLQSIEMDLVDVLVKPIDYDKLTKVLLKAVPKDDMNFDIECFKDIKKLSHNETIQIINSYKGISLENKTSVVSYGGNKFNLKVSIPNIIATKLQKHAIMYIKEANKYIYATLDSIDLRNSILRMKNPRYIDFKQRDKKSNRLLVDKSFKASIFTDNKLTEFDVIYTSFNSIELIPHDDEFKFKVGREFDMTLGFDIASPSSMVKEKKFTKIFANAKIIRIDKLGDKDKIIAILDVKKADQSTFKKYLNQREIDIVAELKKKVRL